MRLTLGGVPLHPALVHFPVAFWVAAPAADLAALLGFAEFWRIGWLLVVAGLIAALPAIAAGVLDAVASRHVRAAEGTVWLHAGLMLLAATIFALALLFVPAHAPTPGQMTAGFALHLLAALCVLAGGHAGGRLAHVFRLPGG